MAGNVPFRGCCGTSDGKGHLIGLGTCYIIPTPLSHCVEYYNLLDPFPAAAMLIARNRKIISFAFTLLKLILKLSLRMNCRMIGFMQNGSLMIGKFYMEAKETGLNMQVDGLN